MRPHFLSAAQRHVDHRTCVKGGFQGLVPHHMASDTFSCVGREDFASVTSVRVRPTVGFQGPPARRTGEPTPP